MKISEIKGVGKATLVGIAADLKEDKTKGGDPFTSLSLEDKQLSIPVKIWNTNLLQFEKAVGEISGKVIEISGEVREYNGSLYVSSQGRRRRTGNCHKRGHESFRIYLYFRA